MVARKDGKMRFGKGFSKSELKEAGVDFKQALRLTIPVDLRRRTRHEENVNSLRQQLGLQVPEISKLPKPVKKPSKPVKAKVAEPKPAKPSKPTKTTKQKKATEISKPSKRKKAEKASKTVKPLPKKSATRREAAKSKNV
jgi:large subunit ribosomal protein L13e